MNHDDKALQDGMIPQGKLGAWLGALGEQGMDIFVPVDKDGKVRYENINDIGDLEVLLDFENSHRPPKDIVFPQSEVLMRYRRDQEEGTLKVDQVRPQVKPTLVFGIRPCDAKAIQVLDSVFSGFNPDPYYWDRRNKVTLVGLGCTDPNFNCFCTTVGGDPHGTSGLDVLLTRIEDGLYALALTEKGAAIMTKAPFESANGKHRTQAKAVHDESRLKLARTMAKGPLDGDGMARVLSTLYDDPLWDEISKKCIGCGACTYICPTCHCFNISDEGTHDRGRRVRSWDTCQFPDFTLHTSSHNPRPMKKHRMRQRVYHKYKYMPENIGEFGCVGCGRCISSCPVNLDIFNIVLRTKEVAR